MKESNRLAAGTVKTSNRQRLASPLQYDLTTPSEAARERLRARGEWPDRAASTAAWVAAADEDVWKAFEQDDGATDERGLSNYLGVPLDECDAWDPSDAVFKEYAEKREHDPEVDADLLWYGNQTFGRGLVFLEIDGRQHALGTFVLETALERAESLLKTSTHKDNHECGCN